jgi:hypothetical protein
MDNKYLNDVFLTISAAKIPPFIILRYYIFGGACMMKFLHGSARMVFILI